MAFDRHLADVLRSRDTPGSLCFVVLGAGFAGLELALELRERIAAHSDEATAQAARIVLADQAPSIGLALGETPGPAILAALGAARIELRPGVVLEAVTAGSVQLSTGEVIETRTLVATTGLRANLPALLAEVQRDELGRLVTDDTLRVPGLEGVFAAGDSALARVDDGHYALMSCQHAIPMGTYAGHNAVRDLLGPAAGIVSQKRLCHLPGHGPLRRPVHERLGPPDRPDRRRGQGAEAYDQPRLDIAAEGHARGNLRPREHRRQPPQDYDGAGQCMSAR
jgi:NADH dehydrogenase FAD-containing subunit